MSFFGRMFSSIAPKLLGGLFRSGAKGLGTMAVDTAKQAAMNLARQKAAEAAASLAKTAADKTGLTGLIGQDLVDKGAGLASDGAKMGVDRVFQR